MFDTTAVKNLLDQFNIDLGINNLGIDDIKDFANKVAQYA